ncbi:reverse transcriptase N-terminal domain-containing protein [Methanosarcina barkeri]|uniref:Retron-type RNA-directed DNA polymerase n=1 Tax=Methanosarcina barkeri 227 TaxID=1434106 RepID=A0A0E3R3X5_METBA|nr:reverse transcriptase N-terminal domain-containing protein [Methanosarcina barkeri]AKB59490.1 Retron-type RNA-directed DNA polymerase [Methanosarcina barkeri 227]
MKGGKLLNVSFSTISLRDKKLTNAQLYQKWKTINWHEVKTRVNKLQTRITKAVLQNKWNLVKRLQYLLTHSYCAKLLAVRRVTQNKGKRTPGIDGEKWLSSVSKMKAVLSLTGKRYKAKPLKRVFINKPGKKKKRPLGIPTMYDRAIQSLYSLSLEPVAETKSDLRSFGFRKNRSARDACQQIFLCLSKKNSAQWILEGDIKGCFDNINHKWLLTNVPIEKSILTQFLKAGFIYKHHLNPTKAGTPQGGIISPILANMTLDGIEKLLFGNFPKNNSMKIIYFKRTSAERQIQ